MILMLEDTEVLMFNIEENKLKILNHSILPFILRSKLRNLDIKANLEEQIQVRLNNIQSIKEYLSERVLSLSRDNAKGIFAVLGVAQSNNIDTRIEICLKCRGISLTDAYWIKKETESLKWNEVDIRKQSFSKVIMDVALYNKNPTITQNYISPEFTNKGLYRKAWTRNEGTLELIKSDKTNDFIGPKMEVLASDILSCIHNINSVSYRLSKRKDIVVSICENFVKDGYSFVEAYEIQSLYGKEYKQYMIKNHMEFIANMIVTDYIIMNTDRHLGNYGFLMNNKTGKLEKYAPLFDFNLALVSDYFGVENSESTLSQTFNDLSTIKELAFEFKRHSTIKIDEERLGLVTRENKEYEHVINRVIKRIERLGL